MSHRVQQKTFLQQLTPEAVLGTALAASLLVHVFMGAGVAVLDKWQRREPVSQKVKVSVVETIPPKPVEVPQKKIPPKEIKPVSERKPDKKVVETMQPVAGLSKESFTDGPSNVSAAAGNTLLAPDEGKRIDPNDIKALSGEDLSSDPKLIFSTMKTPQYTDDAVDANLEGLFVVDVFVDKQGIVQSVELVKRVGFGMDERILGAARAAQFVPRKDRVGNAIEGWTQIKFKLELPR